MTDASSDPRPPKPIDREAPTVSGSQAPSGPPNHFSHAGDAPAVPKMVGKYRVISLIGQGGMGAVYLAEQDNPRRTVALKVIKPGVVSRSLLRRFELEAQVLGRLQHPGIAQIFEAGTFDIGHGAQPYFAMEYIKGRPLTELVLERHAPTKQRLELMAKIADAVHHAHQKGVVHRDLKPGNILVVEDRISSHNTHGQESVGFDDVSSMQPKILDFGVARATDADIQLTTVQTDIGQLIGTLPYMSPEQVAGDPNEVDTRSDVYALGVIAYELLGGRLPHDVARKTVAQAARMIAEEDPTPLSAVNRVLRGDVETIVGKSLEKDKSRRYQSAADLAADIRRYLRDETIIARPPTTLYTLSKFAKRNKTLVGGVIAVFITIILGLAGTAWKAVEATHQRDEAVTARTAAELEANKSKAINDFLIKKLLGAASPSVAQGKTITVEMILDEAVKSIDGAFPDQPELEGSIRNTIGETYVGLGQFDDAKVQFEAAHVAMVKAMGPNDVDTLTSLVNIAVAENYGGHPAEAAALLTSALPAVRTAMGEDHRVTLIAQQVLAVSYTDQGKFNEAVPLLKSVMDTQLRVLGPDHDDTQVSMNNYAFLLGEMGRNAESEPIFRQLWEHRTKVLGPVHPRTISSMNNLAVTLSQLGRSDEAEVLFRDGVTKSREVLGDSHPDTADAMANLGSFLGNRGKPDQAIELLRSANEVRVKALGPEHPTTLDGEAELVALLRLQGKYEEAAALGEQVVEKMKRVHAVGEGENAIPGADHPQTLSAMQALAVVHYAAKQYDKAEPMMREVYESRKRVLGDEHPDTISSQNNVGAVLLKMGRVDEAEPYVRGAMEASIKVNGPEHRQTLNTMNILAGVCNKQGKTDAAAELLTKVLEGRRTILGHDHPDTQTTLEELLDFYTKNQQFERAETIAVGEYERCNKEHGAADPATQKAVTQLVTLYEAWSKPDETAKWRALLTESPATPQTP